jgi:hypothetical protein
VQALLLLRLLQLCITLLTSAGKTFLACWVTSAAKKVGRTIYAFPSHRDKDAERPGTQTLHADTAAISIMHSLLFQLASRDADIQTMLTDSDRSDLQTNTKVAKELLADVLKYAGDTLVVIDGLDEVEEFQRVQFLTSLMEILDASADPKLKICISSRAEDDIARILEPRAVTIRVDKENTSAIFTYVNSRYEQWMENADFLDDGAREIKSLLQPVCAKAKGKFRGGFFSVLVFVSWIYFWPGWLIPLGAGRAVRNVLVRPHRTR